MEDLHWVLPVEPWSNRVGKIPEPLWNFPEQHHSQAPQSTIARSPHRFSGLGELPNLFRYGSQIGTGGVQASPWGLVGGEKHTRIE